ncbi:MULTISPECIES: hypothetical protein [Myxococcus]|uniref:Uncharacterized protein n=1 Tax=Myxococcus virescens TaxID=83456 RepID=A0A511H7K0_9BACT|nr:MULTISPECIES: hypothetical protein [Myxococcus]QDE83224.1 hypothetical protein BHS07_17590 [Myxococcus xanthus]WAM29974.1 hypothetical protein OZ403_18310 [Myxococcus sp. NMCA1]WNZ65508.1 hypothetical protein QEG98_18940 [Myxococcus sp. MxC21-1]SDE48549.1 hypothetical protein SAMN04488504_107225 [Myxococcus virescens]GEL68739.1 hypothetical protein MVI01_05230 [Myxococcus virescens]
MEWLEFSRWSPEVEKQLAMQAARLGTFEHRGPQASRRSAAATTVSATCRLSTVLRQFPRTNPWGHPISEC